MGLFDNKKAKHSKTSSYIESINEEDNAEHKHKRTSSVSFRTGAKSSGRRRSSYAGEAAGEAESGTGSSSTRAAEPGTGQAKKNPLKLDIPPFYTHPEERVRARRNAGARADRTARETAGRAATGATSRTAGNVSGGSTGRSGGGTGPVDPKIRPVTGESGTSSYERRSGRRSGRHTGEKKGHGCLVPILVLLAIVVGGYFLFRSILSSNFDKIERTEVKKDKLEINNTDKNMSKYQNIVLFGVDDQNNKIYDKGSRTDSIIIASIKKSDKSVKLMSVYRDTYVSIDGKYDKINAAYSFGGPELAIRTLNRNLDLNISDFATVNFKALADAVDILGGIDLTIESEAELKNLNDYIGNMNKINGGHSPKFKTTGKHHFDGNQAVAYSRIRYMAGGDHARANHQRLVVKGILNKAKSQPWKIGKLTDTVLPQCKTSLTSSQMTSLFMAMMFMDLKASKAYPFKSSDVRYNGIYYGFPTTVSSNVKRAHKYLFGTKNYKPCDELMRISEKVKIVTNEIGLTE